MEERYLDCILQYTELSNLDFNNLNFAIDWSFFDVFKAPSFALVNSASQSKATGLEIVENDTFVMFRLPKRSHNPSLVPISS